jgi:ABC-type enterochelin transport system substrate-binding protein
MKKLIFIALSVTLLSTAFTSCRDQKTEKETLIEEMKEDGADIKVKDNGDKIKMETDDKEVKIKTDDEGNTKIKVDDNN